jgi:hypothetical protein
MSQTNSDLIFEMLLQDPCFRAEQPESTHGIWKELCGTVETVLEESLLSAEVTVTTFVKARLCILEHMMANGWKERILRAHYTVELEMMDGVENVISTYRIINEQFMRGLSMILKDVPGFMERHKITAYDFFAHPQTGRFKQETLSRWFNQPMTIRDLLLLQPRVLFKNSD